MNYQMQYELIKKVQKVNCNHSFHILLKDYENLLRKTVNHFSLTYKNVPLQYEDLWNYACFYFYEIINEYKFSQDKTFASYAKDFLFYKLSNMLKTYATKSNQVMNYSSEIVEDLTSETIESEDEDKKLIAIKAIDLNEVLTKKEIKVLKHISNGKTYKQTAKIMKLTIDNVYQLFFRAKEKMIKRIEKEESKNK